MNPENKVLACVDRSHYAVHVADYAAWAARRLDAPLEFLHVIDRHPERGSGEDHSGAIGFGAQENLLTRLTVEDETRTRLAREQGRVFVNRLRERAIAAGVAQVDMRLRYGELEETLSEQSHSVRLVVLGRRGEAAEATRRDLGRNVERVVRALDRPILTITEGFQEPRRVLIAFDGSPVTRRAVDMVAASPLFAGLQVRLLMAGRDSAETRRKLDAAQASLQAAGHDVSTLLTPGDAETVIARAIKADAIDLLVMGAYSHSPLHSLLLGSKTTDLLRAASIPTLLLR